MITRILLLVLMDGASLMDALGTFAVRSVLVLAADLGYCFCICAANGDP
jgi:hypothetical protein